MSLEPLTISDIVSTGTTHSGESMSVVMGTHRRFDEELRSIGQALDVDGVTSFELNNAKAGYFIRDLGEHRPSLRSGLRRWLQGRHGDQTYGFDLTEVEALSK